MRYLENISNPALTGGISDNIIKQNKGTIVTNTIRIPKIKRIVRNDCIFASFNVVGKIFIKNALNR